MVKRKKKRKTPFPEMIEFNRAAQWLGVRREELEQALLTGNALRGHAPPQPKLNSEGNRVFFNTKEVLIIAKRIQNEEPPGGIRPGSKK